MPETSKDPFTAANRPELPSSRTPADGTLLLTLMGVHALLRLALLNINQGEYTDGILQLTQFERTDSFWPPLYTALVWLLRLCSLEALTAGRLVSVGASVALLPALWWTARTWAGRRSALFAGILYTVSPVVMRWSIRVMTDMTFVCLFQWACAAILLLWNRDGHPHPSEPDKTTPLSSSLNKKRTWEETLRQRPALTLIGLTILSVLATLTRYQGLLLAPVVAGTLVALWLGRLPATHGQRHRPWGVLAVQLTWLALPAWLLFQRFGHVQQIASRVPPGDFWTVATTYWGRFEMFLYLTPYILTLPVFVFFMTGLLGKPTEPQEQESQPDRKTNGLPLRGFFLYCTVCVLVAQTAFLSFQERYLMPLLPFALICAGAGMARCEQTLAGWGKRGHTLFQALVLLTIFWSFGFGLLAIVLQRGAFADLYDAGRYLRSLTDLPADTRIYTTESYGAHPGMEGIHLSFVSGRKASPLLGKTGDLSLMTSGSLVVIDSRSIQGWDPSAPPTDPAQGFGRYWNFIQYLRTRYNLKLLKDAEFTHSTVPLLPDILGAGGEQSETAWLARYQKQMFKTCVFVVEAKP